MAVSLVVLLLVGAPVVASGDDEPPVVPTLCSPADESADPALAPPTIPDTAETSTTTPSTPPCLPACEDDDDGADVDARDGEAVDPADGDPAASSTAVPTTTPPVVPSCLPVCEDDLSDDEGSDDEASNDVVADDAVADDAASDAGAVDPAVPTTIAAPGIVCIPAAELEAVVEASTELTAAVTEPMAAAADPALPVEPMEPIEPIQPIEPELEAPVIPEAPETGWPIRPIAFPVHGPVRYDDDWGNCRGGPTCPRLHIGNDIVGVRLQPLVAAADGVVTHLVQNHPTAGWGLVITDADGWDYRYYHVNNDTPGTDDGQDDGTWRFIDGLAVGSEVIAGQVVGFMGDSGNSEHSVPHLHFEIHQPDDVAINPFRSLHLAEWIARCGGASDPYREVIVPVPFPATATQPVDIHFGTGEFLVGHDGSWAAIGDARRSGDSRHVAGTPACPLPG